MERISRELVARFGGTIICGPHINMGSRAFVGARLGHFSGERAKEELLLLLLLKHSYHFPNCIRSKLVCEIHDRH